MKLKRPIGVHVSIAGGIQKAVDRAKALDCTTFQIFTRSSRSWKYNNLDLETVKLFQNNCRRAGYTQIIAHMPYLPNFATNDPEIREKSLISLNTELDRCDLLGISFLVIHLGSHKGAGRKVGQSNLVNALEKTIENENNVKIVLENSSGSKNSIGSSFADLGQIFDNLSEPEKFGVCFDTCHAFAAGYDLRSEIAIDKSLGEFDQLVGINRIKVVHANDSKGGLGEGKDRHQHIGLGKIGKLGFKAFFKKNINAPIILETPINEIRDDRKNLEVVRFLNDF